MRETGNMICFIEYRKLSLTFPFVSIRRPTLAKRRTIITTASNRVITPRHFDFAEQSSKVNFTRNLNGPSNSDTMSSETQKMNRSKVLIIKITIEGRYWESRHFQIYVVNL